MVDQRKHALMDVVEHIDKNSCWIVIHDSVYDVTRFLKEHPGGEEVLLDQAGKDATEHFEDVGHSTDARTLMEDYLIGELNHEDKSNRNAQEPEMAEDDEDSETSSLWKTWVVPVALTLIACLIFQFFFNRN